VSCCSFFLILASIFSTTKATTRPTTDAPNNKKTYAKRSRELALKALYSRSKLRNLTLDIDIEHPVTLIEGEVVTLNVCMNHSVSIEK
jgi:hypothetical protein